MNKPSLEIGLLFFPGMTQLDVTGHWLSRDQLAMLGAIPIDARVVVDRNRISGGGVTAGVDFAFQLAAELCGEDVAKRLQLLLEYDPKPPFDITERNAPADMVAGMREAAQPMLQERLRSSERAVARLREGRLPITS